MKRSILFTLLFFPFLLAAQTESNPRKWWAPDHAKLQFAGNIGFVSAGFGYSFTKQKKLETDLYYGYVPERYGNLHSITLKNTWFILKPLTVKEKTKFYLLSFGIPINYSIGKEYFLIAANKYPKRYYDYSSALRFNFFLGGKITHAMKETSKLKELGVYYELGTYDLAVHNHIFNVSTLKFRNLFNLGLGVKAGF
jgi:hypothetical protein